MINGQILTNSVHFDFLLKFPVVSSRTSQIQSDPDGNVYWSWHIPEKMLVLARTYNLHMRPLVAAMINGQLDALYSPVTPIQMGFYFVPNSIYQDLTSRGDEIRFGFTVKSNNENARSYSDRIILKDLSSPVSILPKKNVVVVPLR
jgi:hypothetical protein